MNAFIKEGIPEGHIVVAASKDDCMTSLSQKARHFFAKMGSKEIWNLAYRQGYAFIGISGRKDGQDKRSPGANGEVAVSQVFLVDSPEISEMSSELEELLGDEDVEGSLEGAGSS